MTRLISERMQKSLLKINSLIASPRYIRGCCLMLERRYGFRAGAWVGKALF